MVDVGTKTATARVATASGRVFLGQEAFALVVNNKMAKGDVLPTAQLAGAGSPALPHSSLLGMAVCT